MSGVSLCYSTEAWATSFLEPVPNEPASNDHEVSIYSGNADTATISMAVAFVLDGSVGVLCIGDED